MSEAKGWVCPVCGRGMAPWKGKCNCVSPPKRSISPPSITVYPYAAQTVCNRCLRWMVPNQVHVCPVPTWPITWTGSLTTGTSWTTNTSSDELSDS